MPALKILSPAQCRAARGLLAWTQEELALRSGASRSTVKDFEAGRHALHQGTERLLVEAFEAGGVLLLAGGEPGSGLGPGVRLRSPT